VVKYSILSLFTKFHPLGFQLRQKKKKKKNFPVLECEIGFWELRLGILGALSLWLSFITFELRFTELELVLLKVLFDIRFCFKCWKETLWFHLEYQRNEILTPDIALIQIFLQIFFGWNLECVLLSWRNYLWI